MYCKGEEHLHLAATFTRCCLEPRGAVLMTLFPYDFDGENEKDETRARGWSFSERDDMVEVLEASSVVHLEGANVLVFWRGDEFQAPVEIEATESLLRWGDRDSIYYAAIECVREFFWETRTSVAFVHGIRRKKQCDEEETTAKVVDKVLHYVGQVSKQKTTTEAKDGGASKKRKMQT